MEGAMDGRVDGRSVQTQFNREKIKRTKVMQGNRHCRVMLILKMILENVLNTNTQT